MLGDLPTTSMLKRFRVSDPQLLSRIPEAVSEELFYQHYWGIGFDCYERSFHNLLDRQYEDEPMDAILSDLRKQIAAQSMHDDYAIANYLQSCEHAIDSVWKNLKLQIDTSQNREARWALSLEFKVAHPSFRWRWRLNRGKVTVHQLVDEYRNEDVWFLYFPIGYAGWGMGASAIGKSAALRLLGMKDDYRFDKNLEHWVKEKPFALRSYRSDVQIAEVMATHHRQELAELCKGAESKEAKARLECLKSCSNPPIDDSSLAKVGFAGALAACHARCLEYIDEYFGSEECAWRGSDPPSSRMNRLRLLAL